MPLTYKHLTLEQQRTTAEQQAFSAEHAHWIATIEVAADPLDAAAAERVVKFEKLAVAAQVLAEAKKVEEAQATADAAAEAGEVVP